MSDDAQWSVTLERLTARAEDAEERARLLDERVRALNAELAQHIAATYDMVRGRTTPPTDAEIALHESQGGQWIVRIGGMLVSMSVLDGRRALDEAQRAREDTTGRRPTRRWWAADATGCLRPWPVVAT